jgi:hypothetical protein
MDEQPTPESLSRRAFLRRVGRVGVPAAEPGDDSEASGAEPSLTPETARQRLEALGVTLMPLSAGEDRLQVQCKHMGERFGRDEMKLLEPLAPRIAWLDVATTGIDDQALESVATMSELRRLYLQHTMIEGDGLVHLAELAKLEYLNLYGTNVGDAALEQLAAMGGLQTVYLWQTQVSEEGVDDLRARRPDLTVEFGNPFLGT